MRESPILFSAPMVRAILDGRKTVTRRVVDPQPPRGHSFVGWCTSSTCRADEGKAVWSGGDQRVRLTAPHRVRCPYGMPGDRLWVRETFKEIASGEVKNGYGEVRFGYAYQADGGTRWASRPTIIHDLRGQPPTGPMQFQSRPWKPSIHMPRRASRITLEVTGVRVERLQDISEEDAIAEGINPEHTGWASEEVALVRSKFSLLWEQINGAGSWDANPWVWVVEFRRIEQEARACT